MIKDYGFHPDQVEFKPEDYVFGAGQLAGVVLQEDGDWTNWIPIFEAQAPGYETSGCTVFGTLNALEMLHKRLFGNEPNYSDRFTYINAGITLAGANPQNACESIRKQGVIDQELLPMPQTYAEFAQPKPMFDTLLDKGKQWKFSFGHDWVLKNEVNNERLRQALRYSPLGVSVTAWEEKDGVYIDSGRLNNHWCVLVKFDGDKPVVFDSYKKELKTLSADHKIFFAKRYSLSPQMKGEEVYGGIIVGIFKTLWALIKRLWS